MPALKTEITEIATGLGMLPEVSDGVFMVGRIKTFHSLHIYGLYRLSFRRRTYGFQ